MDAGQAIPYPASISSSEFLAKIRPFAQPLSTKREWDGRPPLLFHITENSIQVVA